MYKCPNCGGEIEFLPDSGIIKCEYCGSEFTPESQELNKTRKKAQEQKVYDEDYAQEGELHPGKVYTCSQCGASIFTTEDTGVTFCSYCGSQAFLESRMRGTEDLMPDLIIPFRVNKEKCEQIYKDKIKTAWFLPRKMKADTTIDKFRGIYMPCWVYTGEVEADGDYTGVTTNRSGAYDVIKTYRVNANARATYGGFVKDATASFPDGIMREIAPYDMHNAREFNDKYMTGFYADIGNVPSDVYKDEIYRAMDANIKNDLAEVKTIKKNHITAPELRRGTEIRSKITDVRKGFFPVWFLSNKNERTGLMSYAVINGVTGKIHADLPVDMKKYLLLSLLIAIPVFILLQFFTMKPTTLLVITMLLLGIMMFFSTKMIGDAYIQQHGLDDEGLLYTQNKTPRTEQEADEGSFTARKKSASSVTSAGKGRLIAGRVLAGIVCFIGLPFLAAIASQILGISLTSWGFIIGVALFIMIVGGVFSNNKISAAKGDFEPGKKAKLPAGMVLRAILLPLIGVAAGVIVLITQPVHDLYYYGAAVLCCIMLILTVLDFVRSNNRLSLRKPAQLGKRGGDEND